MRARSARVLHQQDRSSLNWAQNWVALLGAALAVALVAVAVAVVIMGSFRFVSPWLSLRLWLVPFDELNFTPLIAKWLWISIYI